MTRKLTVIGALAAGLIWSGAALAAEMGKDAVGRIYHYQRSNVDGSYTEEIHVFRESKAKLIVYKMRSKCTNAAYVTADLDLDLKSAVRMTGGRLRPEAGHEDFGVLTYDPGSQMLTARMDMGEPMEVSMRIEHTPWHLFDFDFASLTAIAPHLPKEGFSFGLPLIWPNPSQEMLQYLGDVTAAFEKTETHMGVETRRYALSGGALNGNPGTLWLHAKEGHIVDAEMPIPNHPGYADFKLALQSVNDGGPEAWEALLRSHYEGCEQQ